MIQTRPDFAIAKSVTFSAKAEGTRLASSGVTRVTSLMGDVTHVTLFRPLSRDIGVTNVTHVRHVTLSAYRSIAEGLISEKPFAGLLFRVDRRLAGRAPSSPTNPARPGPWAQLEAPGNGPHARRMTMTIKAEDDDGDVEIIEVEDEDGDDDGVVYEVDTATASREELVEAYVKLEKAYDGLGKAWDKRTAALTAFGLSFCDNGVEVSLDVVDRGKADAWFAEALADLAA